MEFRFNKSGPIFYENKNEHDYMKNSNCISHFTVFYSKWELISNNNKTLD